MMLLLPVRRNNGHWEPPFEVAARVTGRLDERFQNELDLIIGRYRSTRPPKQALSTGLR